MILFSFAFYFVFSYLREQVCVTICPYGRLQGVMLDKNSIAVYYDFERGEPRGKIRKQRKKAPKPKKEVACTNPCAACRSGGVCEADKAIQALIDPKELVSPELPKLGDCIDCSLCVKVCPTGIDIRDGIQLECVNCTACMDACDEVMEKIKRPKGLIRYDSYNGIVKKRKKLLTPRAIAYSVVLVLLLVVEVALLVGRSDVETLLFRTPGMLFQKTQDGQISNLYNYQIINKTTKSFPIEFQLVGTSGQIRLVGAPPVCKKNEVTEGALFIDIPPEVLTGRKTKVKVAVYSNGERIDQIQTNFLGPVQ
ncbi:MAG: 4Fe-4S dicluster domain-containing protein, partial [Bacteroidota bacterium]